MLKVIMFFFSTPFIYDDYDDGVGGDHHNQGEQPGHREHEHEVEELLNTSLKYSFKVVASSNASPSLQVTSKFVMQI